MKYKALRGQSIWITDASSDIGRALVKRLAEQENFIIASGKNSDELADLLTDTNGTVATLAINLTASKKELSKASAALQDITDYLDVIICCSSIYRLDNDLSFDPDTYQEVFDANVLDVVKSLHIAMPLLKQSKNPKVVIISSMSALLPLPRAQAYGASKAALDYLAESLCIDSHGWPMDVTLVRSGLISPQRVAANNDFYSPYTIDPEEAARLVVEGVEKNKKTINFPKRLYWPMFFLSKIRTLWISFIGPKISRHRKHTWLPHGSRSSR